ncbi:Zn-dependent hydrolase [Saccharopolyspora subtropica]|uniref:Allantoate amidohydrolase n=1 Tax=Saccharopolyspora thermophila TaxID=89367 RepID=A0A917NE51_9PSEU|nr:allantoate amidohydrolase [Saccharopolyspora subtropica]GGI91896.1 Zn-dependent hydrolase [Saccharopolyspora subtropica]
MPDQLNTVTSLLRDIADVGTDPVRGGYSRPVFSRAELDLRAWFSSEAAGRGLDVETDRNGIMWAWLDTPAGERTDAVVTGSHLDSVPGGGGFDGPLGVVSALAAVDLLRSRGHQLRRPLAVAVFPEEEGSRFGLACLGSGIMTGTVDVARALKLTDQEGDTLADVAARNGLDPNHIGPDREMLDRIGVFVELHVEQGRGLVHLDQPVAIGSSIIGHGRWRLTVAGQGNHAGTTLMPDRRDPMIVAARIVLAAQETARSTPSARATVGRITPIPGGTNVIASAVEVWLDVRHPDDEVARAVVQRITDAAHEAASQEGCTVALREESFSPTAHFDCGLQQRLVRVLPHAPILETGAGHDAGVLAPFLPTAMLFVRNPSGISHSPEERAEPADCAAGAEALAAVLADLTGHPDTDDPVRREDV